MNIYKRTHELIEANKSAFAICTVIETEGSAPRHHAKMLVHENGEIEFTIGGGPVEFATIKEAVKAIELGKSKVIEWHLNKDLSQGLNMTCGGQMKIHIEVYNPNPELILIGAGHVNLAVYKMAKELPFKIKVIDDRPELSLLKAFENVEVTAEKDDIVAAIHRAKNNFSKKAYFVIATKDCDEIALKALADVDANYIGLIGSRRKTALIRENLTHQGYDSKWIEKIKMPIGLNLGGELPSEIALSILAEINTIRYQKDALPHCLNIKETQEKSVHTKTTPIVLIRGAGDMATGTALRLKNAGYQVVCTELPQPTAIRHSVSFAGAILSGTTEVEGQKALRVETIQELEIALEEGSIPIYVGDEEQLLKQLKPSVFVEATLRKKAIDINKEMAPLVIGLGPGFEAEKQVDCVIETMRGHYLGRIIWKGSAQEDTGIPGDIGGFTHERVIKSPCPGLFKPLAHIGDQVYKGQVIAEVQGNIDLEVKATIDGILRGILPENIKVSEGFKVADIDPRAQREHCFTISDKARAIAGGVLEAILMSSHPFTKVE